MFSVLGPHPPLPPPPPPPSPPVYEVPRPLYRPLQGGAGSLYRKLLRYPEGKSLRLSANEGPMRIQYKWLVPIYVFPETKLCSLFISKPEL